MATDLEMLQEAIETAYAVLDEMMEQIEASLDEDDEAELAMSDFIADDSLLLHADGKRKYDPKKAHDYYMRTRKLKGRKPASLKTPKITDYSRGEKLWLDLSAGNTSLIELRRKHDTSENRKRVKELFSRWYAPQRTVARVAVQPPTILTQKYLTVVSSMLRVFGADKASTTLNKASDLVGEVRNKVD